MFEIQVAAAYLRYLLLAELEAFLWSNWWGGIGVARENLHVQSSEHKPSCADDGSQTQTALVIGQRISHRN